MFYDQYYIKSKKGWCRSSLYLRSISREGGGGGGERKTEIIYPSVYSCSCRALHDVERWCFCITITFVPVFNEAFYCCCIQLPNRHKNL